MKMFKRDCFSRRKIYSSLSQTNACKQVKTISDDNAYSRTRTVGTVGTRIDSPKSGRI